MSNSQKTVIPVGALIGGIATTGVITSVYSHHSWVASTLIVAVVIIMEMAGQLFLFSVAYKLVKRSQKYSYMDPSYTNTLFVISCGFIATLWFAIVVTFLARAIGIPLLNTLHGLTLGWLGTNIVITFLFAQSSKPGIVPNAWINILSTGFGLQLTLFLLWKLA